MKKVKCFLHTDLDGVGIVPILSQFKEVDWTLTNYDSINSQVLEFINNEQNNEIYDLLLISDISITKETADLIEAIKDFKTYKIQLIDHHVTAEHLVDYDWCLIKNKTENYKHSGTELSYQWLLNQYPEVKELKNKSIVEFVELVRAWDTWDWFVNGIGRANQLNDLIGIYGFKKFVELTNEKLKENKEFFEFNKTDLMLLEINESKYQSIKKKHLTNMSKHKFDDLKYGLIIGSEFISRVANEICLETPDIDFVVAFDGYRGLSLRSVKENINCIQIATHIGNKLNCPKGGHTKAAGVTIKREDISRKICELINV
ncbi:MAG: hypothetical protein ACRCW9_06415 [Cetobacterium sp.]